MLIKILAFPFRIIYYLFHHLRLLLLIIVVSGGVMVYNSYHQSQVAAKTDDLPQIQQYQTSAPSKKACPYVFQTSSRIYYASEYKTEDDIYTLLKYYAYDKGWDLYTEPLSLDPDIYGKVRKYERK